jgi:hypothetical protein
LRGDGRRAGALVAGSKQPQQYCSENRPRQIQDFGISSLNLMDNFRVLINAAAGGNVRSWGEAEGAMDKPRWTRSKMTLVV